MTAGGSRVGGKAVAELLEREAAARGDLAGGRERLRQIGEPSGHLDRGAEVALGVRRKTPAEGVQRGPEPDGRQDVDERPLAGCRVQHSARGHDGEPSVARERHGPAGRELALARAVPLELHVEPVPPDGGGEPSKGRPRRLPAPGEEVRGQRTVQPAREADESLPHPVQIVPRRPRPPLRPLRLHPRDETAQCPVSRAGFHEEREARAVRERESGPDQGAHTRRLRRLVKARRAVDAVYVDEREGGELEPRRLVDEPLGRGRGFEEAERAPRGQLDVTRHPGRVARRAGHGGPATRGILTPRDGSPARA